MLCLKCGSREQHAENLCAECLLERYVPFTLPDVVHGTVCPECNRMLKGRSWIDCPGSFAEAAVQAALGEVVPDRELSVKGVEMSVDRSDNNLFFVSGTANGVYRGLYVSSRLSTEVRLGANVCPFCSRKKGNYFEAIVQLRGLDHLDDDRSEMLVNKVLDDAYLASRKDPNIFLTKDEKVRGGHDFYFGNNSFAKQIARDLHDSFGGEAKTSTTLFGRKDGRDIYRSTYLVRLPGFMAGDYLVDNKGRYKVLKVHKKVQIRDISTWQDRYIDMADAMSMSRFGAGEIEKDLVVIMETGTEVQVMHPDSYLPKDLVKPPGFSRDGSPTVRCALFDGEVFLV